MRVFYLRPNRGDEGGHRECIDRFAEPLDDLDDERLPDTQRTGQRLGAETRGDRTTTYREMDIGFCPEQVEAEIRVRCDARHCASVSGLPGASRSIR